MNFKKKSLIKEPVVYALVGHRGVGKSSLLKRIKSYVPSAHCWDLDEEIEKVQGESLIKIFEAKGESRFRQIEGEVFHNLLAHITQISSSGLPSHKWGSPQVGFPQLGFPQLGFPQLGFPQVGFPQLGFPQLGFPQVGFPQLGFPQLGFPQLGFPQLGFPQLGFPLVGAPLVGGRDSSVESSSSQSQYFVVLGAGYEGHIPTQCFVIWVRRLTDFRGRSFFNRPQLSKKGGSEYDEYLARFYERNKRYKQWANDEITLIEGLKSVNLWEEQIFRGSPVRGSPVRGIPIDGSPVRGSPVRGIPIDGSPVRGFPVRGIPDGSPVRGLTGEARGQLTLLPRSCSSFEKLRFFLRNYEKFFTHFEVRDDFLSEEQINWLRDLLPLDKWIYSYRKTPDVGKPISGERLSDGANIIDWALELGEPMTLCHQVSLHERREGESVQDCCRRLEKWGVSHHLKLAIPIKGFGELWEAHQWWLKDSENRSFLPSSEEGRWSWYRLRQKPLMKINFVKLGSEPQGLSSHGDYAPDQPTLLHWLSCLDDFKIFAAVLGDPIEHSQSPTEQDTYFRGKNIPIFSVQMNESDELALSVLRRLGLRYAAVTSPLKKRVLHYCDKLTSVAQELQSVNTLFLGEKDVVGHNTDVEGLRVLLQGALSPLVVWGGGGTKAAISKILPQAFFYSARSGELSESPRQFVLESHLGPNSSLKASNPVITLSEVETLVWATGRSRHIAWPPHWPKRVIDLNYTEDSPGLEFAIRRGAEYISGQEMFRVQAEGQRNFWESCQ